MIYHKSAPEFRSCLIVSSVRWLEILQMINTYVIELYRLVRAVEFFKRIQEYCQSCVQVGDFGIPNPTCGYTPIWTLCTPTGPIFNPKWFHGIWGFPKMEVPPVLIYFNNVNRIFHVFLHPFGDTPIYPWRIHGAGIYANMTGVYWWDPWSTIYSSTMDPSWLMEYLCVLTFHNIPEYIGIYHPMLTFLRFLFHIILYHAMGYGNPHRNPKIFPHHSAPAKTPPRQRQSHHLWSWHIDP